MTWMKDEYQGIIWNLKASTLKSYNFSGITVLMEIRCCCDLWGLRLPEMKKYYEDATQF